MSNNRLTDKYEWALKEEARVQMRELVDMGLDPDLAFTILERLLPESSIYNLEVEDSNE